MFGCERAGVSRQINEANCTYGYDLDIVRLGVDGRSFREV